MVNILSDLADGMKKLQSLSKELSELELREALMDQRELLLLAREEIHALREEASSHQAEIDSLKQQLDMRQDTVVVEGFRYDSKDDRPFGLAYCPKCEVSEDKFFRLINGGDYNSKCPQCRTVFKVAKDGRVNLSRPRQTRAVTSKRGRH